MEEEDGALALGVAMVAVVEIFPPAFLSEIFAMIAGSISCFFFFAGSVVLYVVVAGNRKKVFIIFFPSMSAYL